MRLIPALFFLILLVVPTQIGAQDLPGDPSAGLVFAREICAECHYVERDWANLYVNEAPSFVDIADHSEHTETSLRLFFVTPHLTMPGLRLDEVQTSAVIAWILSLRRD
ncbi:MAG: hypothetical protein AAGD13_11970 [Pseudomonadota bacterium]